MLQSMTGFGRAEQLISNDKFIIEIKSLNSKNLDLNVKLPQEIKSLELEIRKRVSNALQRGKIEIYIGLEHIEGVKNTPIDVKLLQNYMNDFSKVSPELSPESLFKAALHMPNIFKCAESELNEDEIKCFINTLDIALERILQHRNSEGRVLSVDFSKRIKNILSLLYKVPKYESERLEQIKNRLQKGLEEIQQYNTDRFEQELIFYIEKLDITEEKLRLENHCNYFMEILAQPVSNGKKLNFITQEIGREINTLGAKSNHAEMQKLVVQMKDELEKIKEQILNIV